MPTKHRSGYYCVILGAIMFMSLFIQLASAQELNEFGVSKSIAKDTYMTYNIEASASYRMYANRIKIVVTDPAVYPVKGNMIWIEGDEEIDVSADKRLVPYIIKVDKWEAGVENGPYWGLNDSQSEFNENWIESDEVSWFNENDMLGVTFDKEDVYADSERVITVLRYNHNYTVTNRLDNMKLDNVTALNSYYWDQEFGILLKWRITIKNYNDSSMDGYIRGVLQETSLWALSTEGIPGYSLEFLLIGSVLGVAAFVLIQRRTVQGGVL